MNKQLSLILLRSWSFDFAREAIYYNQNSQIQNTSETVIWGIQNWLLESIKLSLHNYFEPIATAHLNEQYQWSLFGLKILLEILLSTTTRLLYFHSCDIFNLNGMQFISVRIRVGWWRRVWSNETGSHSQKLFINKGFSFITTI